MTQGKGYREMPLEPDRHECNGRLVVLIADESSFRCTECGWMGWPRQDVEPVTGHILLRYPHRRESGT